MRIQNSEFRIQNYNSKLKNLVLVKDEQVFLPIIWKGGEDVMEINVNLLGDGSKIRILGLLIGKKSDSLDIKLKVSHVGKDTKSEVIFKGVLEDESGVNFEGLVKIEKNAKKTSAWLAAHFLLLSEKAHGRAIPALEILENDIKAGHATTVGKINELEMFYLQSRGLSKEQAKQLIVEGFLKSIMDQMPEKSIKY